ncbi:MAG: aminoglycoside phosphotransferase [Alphaproteobacteria bacterium]|nr:aminoglycoside phosphotransferase [Alphaproteobacteria bacterium]
MTQHGWQDAQSQPMSDDASFRRYTRLFRGADRVLLMDSPPPMEYVWKFTQVAGLLEKMGLTVPAIHAVDDCHGLLLEQDFGDLTATNFVNQGLTDDDAKPSGHSLNTTESRLALALSLGVKALIHVHQQWLDPNTPKLTPQDKATIPPYCRYRMLSDVQIFLDWYLPAAGLPAADAECQRLWHQAWVHVIAQQHSVPEVMILRDYRLDNLMILPKAGQHNWGLDQLGVLDFQDAMTAPLTYDLISLLEDARLDFPPDLVTQQVQDYLTAFPHLARADFDQSWATVAAVRHTRILGVFARLWRRDDKPVYLVHLPRVWRQLSQALSHPANAPLAAWFDRYVPLASRQLSDNAAAA